MRGPDDASEAETARRAAADAAPRSLPVSNVTALSSADRGESLRILEALLFAATEPLDEATLAAHLPEGMQVGSLIEDLKGLYAGRGVNLVRVAGNWAFRTADDLAYLLERHRVEERRLSKAALETLSIIAYHQPVTRAEIEEVRGVQTSKGTLDVLMETGWIRPRGRRRAPGKPITYGTSDAFLVHFGFETLGDLPGVADLKAAGLLDSAIPAGFTMPDPRDVAELMPDELPLEEEEADVELPFEARDDALAHENEEQDDGESASPRAPRGRT